MTKPRSVVAAVLAVLVVLSGCGRSTVLVAPRSFPADLVPATIPDPTDPANPFLFVEFEPARDRFARAGERSLATEGRLWEIRRGSNLVGTVEVATLERKVDLRKEDHRRKLIDVLLPGTSTAIKVRSIPVIRSSSDDRVTYLILGDGLFELVDVKPGDKVDPLRLVTALIDAELPTGHLKAAETARRRPL